MTGLFRNHDKFVLQIIFPARCRRKYFQYCRDCKIKQDFKNQKAGHEKNAKKRARNHRTWYGFKNATLINRVDHFYDANEKFSSDDFQKIKDICDRKI